MNYDYRYYIESRKCGECGKVSRKRCYGRIVGGLFFEVLRYTHGGNTIDSHKCPHCGHQHKIAFQKGDCTFPITARGRRYVHTNETEAMGA